ncbi:MAG: hypothetical protein ABIO63_13600 [Casimicrobiaceae bacterium]
MKAWALLLLAGPVLAQPHHAPQPTQAIRAKDLQDKSRGVVMVAPNPGETIDHAAGHALPIGKGADPKLGAWLRPDVTGSHNIPRVEVLGQPNNPMWLVAGRIYRIKPWAGPLVWTPPDGVQGPVPDANLLAVKAADVAKK